MTPSCGHTWEPIPTWFGRYRCRTCFAFGYKQVVMLDSEAPVQRADTHGGTIVPYACKVCKGPAVAKDPPGRKSRTWRCSAHRNMGKSR